MKRKAFNSVLMFVLAFGPILTLPNQLESLANADEQTKTPDAEKAAMEQVLNRYSTLQKDLVRDERSQIKDDATSLWSAAKKVKDKKLSSDIQNAARQMISNSTTGMGHPTAQQATEDFKKLSVPIVEWVKKNKPEGWSVIHCPMVSADWVQKKDQEIQNPYTGKDMRSCGEKVT